MVKGVGFYADFGREVKDLLYKDYNADYKTEEKADANKDGKNDKADDDTLLPRNLSIAITDAWGSQKAYITVGVKSECVTLILNESARFKSVVSFKPTDEKKFCKVELYQKLFKNAGLTFATDMSPKPILNFSAIFGIDNIGFGSDVSFDTASNKFSQVKLGLNYTIPSLAAILNLNLNTAETSILEASVYQSVIDKSGLKIGGEVAYDTTTQEKTFSLGSQYASEPFTLKARINNRGIAGVLQYDCTTKTRVSIAGDFGWFNVIPRVGIALALTL